MRVGSLDPSNFVTSSGRVLVGKLVSALAGTIFGGALLAFFGGIQSSILAVVSVGTSWLGGIATFLAEYVATVWGIPAAIIRGSWQGAAAQLTEFGIASWLATIVFMLVLWRMVAEVKSRVL